MSFASIISSASREAQGVLAQLQGMQQNAAGNFLYNGKIGTAVKGSAQVVEVPQPGGGYRRRAQLNWTVTRDQDFSFEAKAKIVGLATGRLPAITYTIDFIDVHDPLIWTLTLVKAGA